MAKKPPPTTDPRWTEYVPLGDIKRAVRNPKRHDRKAMGSSVDEHGYIEPMVRDERTGRLVGGHGRLDELELRYDAGEKPPEGVTVGEGGVWLAPVSCGWRSENDLQADAAAVTLNHLTEAGGWDQEELTDILSEMGDVDGLLEAAGFSRSELDDMVARFKPPPSLDDLKKRHDRDDTAMWPVLRFKINPRVKVRYDRLVKGLPGDDGDLFLQLVRWAEKGKKASGG